MSSAEILAVLKVGGFALTCLSSVWGILRKVTVDDGDRKRLTPEGHVAIAVAVASAIVASSAYGFETLVKKEDKRFTDQQKAAEDQAKTQEKTRLERIADDREAARVAAAAQADLARKQGEAISRYESRLQRALTLATTDRLSRQEARSSQRALESIWDAATRVDPARVSVAVFNECASSDAAQANMYADTSATMKVAKDPGNISDDRGGSLSQVSGVELFSTEKTIIKSGDGSYVIYSKFVAQEALGRFYVLDGWRDALVQITIEGFERDSARLKTDLNRYQFEMLMDGQDTCEAHYLAMIDGQLIVHTIGIPTLKKIGSDLYKFSMVSRVFGVEENNLPVFQEARSKGDGIRRAPLPLMPPPPPPPPPPKAPRPAANR